MSARDATKSAKGREHECEGREQNAIMCAKGATMSANDAIMCAKYATMSAPYPLGQINIDMD